MKRKIIGLLMIVLFGAYQTYAQVAINNSCSDPDASAMLDVSSTTMGFLVPRMTEFDMNNIANPATGLLVYATSSSSDDQYYYYDGSIWVPFGRTDGDAWGTTGEDLTNVIGRTGRVGIGTLTPDAHSMLHVEGHIWQTAGASQSVYIGDSVAIGENGTNFNNVYVGNESARNSFDAYCNVGIGSSTLHDNNAGFYNVAIGYNALNANTSGMANVAVGEGALERNESGNGNTAFGGCNMPFNTSGSYNVSIGRGSMFWAETGNYNTSFGRFSMASLEDGSYNSAFGTYALEDITTGSYNTALGMSAASHITTGSHNIAIGIDVQMPANTSNYQMNIGNTIYADLNSGNVGFGLYNNAPTQRMDIDGVLRLRASGTPASADAGDIYYDGDHFYVYDGSNWKQIDNCTP